MYKLLLAYRTTPHSTTELPPASVMFGSNLQNKLPSILQKPSDSDLRASDAQAKENMKQYADDKSYVKPSDITIGDHVLVKSSSLSKAKHP